MAPRKKEKETNKLENIDSIIESSPGKKFSLNALKASINREVDKEYAKYDFEIPHFKLINEYPAVEALHTGSETLNGLIGIPGIPLGRFTQLFGPQSSGKTSTAFSIIAEAQKQDMIVFYFDAEGTYDREYAKTFGVDSSKIIFQVSPSVEFIFNYILIITATVYKNYPGKKVLFIIDSLGVLIDETTVKNTMNDNEMMQMARKLKKGFKKWGEVNAKCKSIGTIVGINHVISDTNAYSSPGSPAPTTTPGGIYIKHASSLTIEFQSNRYQKYHILDSEKNIIGIVFRVRIDKNKVAAPHKSGELRMFFDKGFDKNYELFQQGLAFNVIKKPSSAYYCLGEEGSELYYKINGEKAMQELIEKDEKVQEYIREKIAEYYKENTYNHVVVSDVDTDTDANDDDDDIIDVSQSIAGIVNSDDLLKGSDSDEEVSDEEIMKLASQGENILSMENNDVQQ